MSDKISPNEGQVQQSVSAKKKVSDGQVLLEDIQAKQAANKKEGADPLSSLWLQQDVPTVDINILREKWDKVKIKQRFYALVDILSVLFCIVIIYSSVDKLGTFGKLWMYAILVFSGLFAGYYVWLRRFALSWSTASTDGHIQKLQKQLQGSIKIAKINRQTVWWMLGAVFFFYAGSFYFGEIPIEKLGEKVLISLGIILVFGPVCWVWANKRAQRFEKELKAFKSLLGDK